MGLAGCIFTKVQVLYRPYTGDGSGRSEEWVLRESGFPGFDSSAAQGTISRTGAKDFTRTSHISHYPSTRILRIESSSPNDVLTRNRLCDDLRYEHAAALSRAAIR